MRNPFLWTAVLCLVLLGAAQAEEPPKKGRPPEIAEKGPSGVPAMDVEKLQEQMRQSQQQMEKQQQEELERLKKMDPKGYESQKKQVEQQAQINQVLSAYQQKTISAEEAERKLTPLIRQQVQEETAGLDGQIKMLEKKLANLKQAKGNPSGLVKKRVDQMLGRGGPTNPDDLF